MVSLMTRALRIDPNKLGAGNAGAALRLGEVRSRRVLRARGGRFWSGIFGAIGGRMELGGSAWPIWPDGRGRIGKGGILRFFGSHRGRVRMAESEWIRQGIGFPAFPARADQPDRLHRGAGRPIEAGPGGLDPLRRARCLPLPVADGRCQIGQKFRASPATSDLCPAMGEGVAVDGREIPSILMGSGVRAALSARFSDRSERRPKSSQTVGLGGGWFRSGAKRFSEAAKLGPAVRGVN